MNGLVKHRVCLYGMRPGCHFSCIPVAISKSNFIVQEVERQLASGGNHITSTNVVCADLHPATNPRVELRQLGLQHVLAVSHDAMAQCSDSSEEQRGEPAAPPWLRP